MHPSLYTALLCAHIGLLPLSQLARAADAPPPAEEVPVFSSYPDANTAAETAAQTSTDPDNAEPPADTVAQIADPSLAP